MPRPGNKLFLLAPFFLLCHDSRLGLAGRRPQSANQDGTRKVFTVTRQKSSGRQSPACTFYPGDARGCGQGGARAGPHRPGRQKRAHPSAPRLARSGHRDLWGGPPTANQGPRGAHSFTNAAGKEARLGPELRGTLKHPRVLWCRGWSSGGPDRRKLDACRGCPFADYRSFPAIWAWRTILPRPEMPGSARAPAGPAGRPEPGGSLRAQKEAAPGRVPGGSLRQWNPRQVARRRLQPRGRRVKRRPAVPSFRGQPLTAVVLVTVIGAVVVLVAPPHGGDAALVSAPELVLFALLDRPWTGGEEA